VSTYLPATRDVLALGVDPASGPGEFDCRKVVTPPGIVYTLLSDTGMTGRLFAKDNIAYDDHGGEFVFRQPRNAVELCAIGRAQSVEVLGCYRFDGLRHWTVTSAYAWWQHVGVVEGWLENVQRKGGHREIRQGARAYLDYLASLEFANYMQDLLQHLSARPAGMATA
jgi:hypothetical protein